MNGQETRAAELEQIGELYRKALRYAQDDPEVALGLIRKAAEGICRFVFASGIGAPGKIMLDQLVQKLGGAGLLPLHVAAQLCAIRDLGNYGAHAQGGGHRIDAAYVAPAAAALETVHAWFTTEVLDAADAEALRGAPTAAPAPGTPAAAPSSRRTPRRILALAAAVIATAAGAVLLVLGTRRPPGVDAVPPARSAAVEDRGARPESTALRLDLVMKAAPLAGAFRIVGADAPLATGTRVYFEVQVSRPAHVYLAQRSAASGAVAPLFPDPAIAVTNPIRAGTWVRIPARESFVLDERDLGAETVVALAALEPVASLEDALPPVARERDVRKVEAALASAALSDRPGCAGTTRGLRLEGGDCDVRTRGLVLPASDAEERPVASARVQAAPRDSTVVVPFTFRHVRAR